MTSLMTTITHNANGNTTLHSKSPNGSLRVPSLQVAKRNAATTSLEDVPEDEHARVWSEHIRERRVSRKAERSDLEIEDKVLVGHRVEEGHANFEVAYVSPASLTSHLPPGAMC